MAKTIFPEEMLNANEITLENVAAKLSQFELQLHLLHWRTNGYALHKALNELYDYVFAFKDEILEKMMGYTGKSPSEFSVGMIKILSPEGILQEMQSFASSLKNYGEANKFHDVCNLADSFSGSVAKTKYLLTLS